MRQGIKGGINLEDEPDRLELCDNAELTVERAQKLESKRGVRGKVVDMGTRGA